MNARTWAVLADLDLLADPTRLPGMARVGINIDRAVGVSIPHLRRLARRHRPDHSDERNYVKKAVSWALRSIG